MTEQTRVSATSAADRAEKLRTLGQGLAQTTCQLEARPAAPLLEPVGTQLMFANSAVVPFLPDLTRGGIATPATTLQPCFRAHNLRLFDTGQYTGEWLCAFTMFGAFAGDLATACEVGSGILAGLPVENEGFLIVAASRRDEVMAQELIAALPPRLRPVLSLEDTPPKHQLAWKPDYHDWKFGARPLTGRGLTIALGYPDGWRRDLGNLIAFSSEEATESFGFGFGLETVLSALERAPGLIDSLPEGALRPDIPNGTAWIDFLSGSLRATAAGALASSRGPGSIVRQMCQRVRSVTFRAGMRRVEVETTIATLSAVIGVPATASAAVLAEVYSPVRTHEFCFTAYGNRAAVARSVDSLLAAGIESLRGPGWVVDFAKALTVNGESDEQRTVLFSVSTSEEKSHAYMDLLKHVQGIVLGCGASLRGGS